MSIKLGYTCNICGAEKKEVNHWFVAKMTDGKGLLIRPWKYSPLIDHKEAVHLCGQSCVHSFVDGFLEDAMPKPAPAPEFFVAHVPPIPTPSPSVYDAPLPPALIGTREPDDDQPF